MEDDLSDMPKFDFIIQNPPYSKSLHLEFFKAGYTMLSDTGKMVIIEPATWLINIRNNGKSKVYDEIKSLYLSGFSSNKIATLYKVDKASIIKILKGLGVKIRSNKLNINAQELQELINDYQNGYSLKELAKRYDCSSVGLKEFLIKKGVNLRIKYNILKDEKAQQSLINDYLDGVLKLSEIQSKYHCSYATFTKILSINGIDKKGKGTHFKLNSD